MSDDTMIDSIVTALATGTAEGLTDLSRAALARLTRLVYERRGIDPRTAAALTNAHAEPSSQQRRHELRTALTDAMTNAPPLADDARLLWRHLQRRATPALAPPDRRTGAANRPPLAPTSIHSGASTARSQGTKRGPGA